MTRGCLDDAGFDVSFEHAEGYVWATLVHRSNSDSRVPRYGRGTSEDEARASAERRWQVEQVGSPADHREDAGHLP